MLYQFTFAMATTKIVLRKKKTKDGSYPLAIRITKDRKTSFIHIGYNIKEKDWNPQSQTVKKSHPNSARLNNLIRKKLSEATDTALGLEVEKKDTSSLIIKTRVKGDKQVTFIKQADIYIENLQSQGKYNRLSAEKPRINRFKEFLKGSDIPLKEITVQLLERYRAYLKGTRKISERTIINHLIVIRSIINQAIKSDLLNPKYYPFGRNKIVIKFPDAIKLGLELEEVHALEQLDLSEYKDLDHARNIWLFSLYFAGMRIADLLRLKWSDFQNNRLYYAMGKNNKGGSLPIPKKAQVILDIYQLIKDKTGLVFPELRQVEDLDDRYEREKTIKTKLKVINDNLAEIKEIMGLNKKLTMHIARHTFGNLSGEKIPIQMLQKLYRHSSITTTINYQANFMHKDMDDALNSVIE